MRFSVIGNNSVAGNLLAELAGNAEQELVVGAVSGGLAEMISRLQIPLRLAAAAEDALLDGAVGTVILAVDDVEETLRLCRAATQAGKHVVVIPPADCSPAFSFELHLILDETAQAIIPLIGRFQLSRLPPESHSLALDRTGVLQLSTELAVENSTAAARTYHILRGLDQLSACGFEYSQVTALESLAPDGSLLSLLITLNSQASSEKPEPPATLMLKPAVLSSKADSCIRVHRSNGVTEELPVATSGGTTERIVSLCRNRSDCSKWMESFSMTLELAEAVKKSLRRRRTVDVHFDTGSERGVFKSQMTAMGCGVLTFMMFGMVAYLIIAKLTKLPDWVLHIGRILWIAPLVIFLFAQFLLPIARDRSSDKERAS